MSNPPATIYLQWYGDGDPKEPGEPNHADVTWCADRINKNDFEYRLVKRRVVRKKKQEILPPPEYGR